MMTGPNGVMTHETPLLEVNILVDTSSQASILKGVRELTAHAKPKWDHEKVKINALTGGTTNLLLSCDDVASNERILVRIYGLKTELFIDRGAEVRNMRLLHSHGLAPPVHLAFRNGLCYGFIKGEMLDMDMVASPEITVKIANQMAKMHAIPIDGQAKAKIVPMMEHYLSLVPADVLRAAEQTLQKEFGAGKVDVAHEIRRLKQVYESTDQEVVFCHNDLLSKNILLDGDKIHFIDFEYASANYQGFDIGNFFTEFGGQEGYDRSRYPSREWQLKWIKQYLEFYYSLKGLKPPTSADVERLFVVVNKCALSSAILWGLWALIQQAHSTIDFDFKRFAVDRLGMYFAKCDEFLSL